MELNRIDSFSAFIFCRVPSFLTCPFSSPHSIINWWFFFWLLLTYVYMYIYSLPGLLSVAYNFMNSGLTDKCSFLFTKETLHQMETITETTMGHHAEISWLTVRISASVDTSTTQLLLQWLREQCRKGSRKNRGARGPGSVL